MLYQFKYAFLDIRTSKRISLLFLLQIVAVFLLIDYCIISFMRVENGLERLEILKDKNAFINRDATSDERIDALLADESKAVSKMKELYQCIMSNDRIEKYSMYQYTTLESVDDHDIIEATVSNMFFEIYNIETFQGCMFDEKDFTYQTEVVPIIIGYGLKDKYHIGQEYVKKDCATNQDIVYKVVGILKKNSTYPSLVDIGREIDLNYTYFRPLNIKDISDFGSMDMAISSTVIFANSEDDVRFIEQKSVELGLFSMDYKKIHARIKEFLYYFKKKMLYQLFIAFVILMFAGISMALNLVTMISQKFKEFSIHLLCGGSIKDIVQRLTFQLVILISLALIPTAIIYGINMSFIFTTIFAFFIILLVMIIPYHKIKTTNIIQMVRRYE